MPAAKKTARSKAAKAAALQKKGLPAKLAAKIAGKRK